MEQRDTQYTLSGMIVLDEGFFSTEQDEKDKTAPLKRGRSSQMKCKVLVMVESEQVENPKNPQKPKRVNHLKMMVIPDLKAKTIGQKATTSIDKDSKITTDASTSYTNFKNHFAQHDVSVIIPEEISKVLPWVHIDISNAKSLHTNIYHGIKAEFLQGYLNVFCYQFNRTKIPLDPFDRLLAVTTLY